MMFPQACIRPSDDACADETAFRPASLLRLTRQVAILQKIAGLLLDQAQGEQRRQALQRLDGRGAQVALPHPD